jgi:NTP pyrophosphatase (non-canonical NTP hydrolase)
MRLKEFQESVSKLKMILAWHQFHQPKDLLLGMVEEIGEFRNLIKWEQNPENIRKIVLGISKNMKEATADSQMTQNQLTQLYYLASINGKINTDRGEAATDWIKLKANVKDLSSITTEGADRLISQLIREEVVDFFGDMLWLLGSLAEYCEVDLQQAMEDVIKDRESRFLPEKVRGKTARILTGEYDGKYVNEDELPR